MIKCQNHKILHSYFPIRVNYSQNCKISKHFEVSCKKRLNAIKYFKTDATRCFTSTHTKRHHLNESFDINVLNFTCVASTRNSAEQRLMWHHRWRSLTIYIVTWIWYKTRIIRHKCIKNCLRCVDAKQRRATPRVSSVRHRWKPLTIYFVTQISYIMPSS